MQTYIGTKIIQAERMGKLTFHKTIRKFDMTPDNDAGYRVVYADGYVSWSPAAVFNGAYRVVTENERLLLAGVTENKLT